MNVTAQRIRLITILLSCLAWMVFVALSRGEVQHKGAHKPFVKKVSLVPPKVKALSGNARLKAVARLSNPYNIPPNVSNLLKTNLAWDEVSPGAVYEVSETTDLMNWQIFAVTTNTVISLGPVRTNLHIRLFKVEVRP